MDVSAELISQINNDAASTLKFGVRGCRESGACITRCCWENGASEGFSKFAKLLPSPAPKMNKKTQEKNILAHDNAQGHERETTAQVAQVFQGVT